MFGRQRSSRGFSGGVGPGDRRTGEGRRSGGTSGTGRVKVDLADNRSFAIVESSPPAGALGPPRHIHDEYDEAWYVLDGEMEFNIGDRVELCESGSLAFAPRGVAHGFRNPGPRNARLLVVMTAECLQLVEEGGAAAVAGDRSALSEIFRRYRSRMAE